MKIFTAAITAIACIAASPALAAGPNIRAVSDLTAAEGQNVDYNVLLVSPTTAVATATLRLNNGTATAGSDFSPTLQYSDDNGASYKTAANGAATIRAGVSAFRVRVSLLTDAVNEGNETYSLNIFPGNNLGNVTGYGAGVITNVAPTTTQPPVAASWTQCATEGGQCAFTGTRNVRYGTTAKFVTRALTNGTACSNAVFGDPIYGVSKACWVEGTTTASGGSGVPTTPTTPTTPNNPPVASTGSIPTMASIAGKRVVGRINAVSGQVIENLHITTTEGPCIVVPSNVTNVVIRNNEIGPCGSRQGTLNNEGVYIASGATNITVQRNVIHDISTGVFAAWARHPIIIDRNMFYNIRGPFWQGQMVQFNNVREGTGSSRITCNVKDGRGNFPAPVIGNISVEDHLSLFHSKGVSPSQPIEIAYNRIRGGMNGGGRSGTGIQSGDGGQLTGGNYNFHHNTIVQTNGAGISFCVGGENVRIADNIVDNRGEVPSTQTSWSYVIQKNPQFTCSNIQLVNNRSTVAKGWAWDGGGNLTGFYTVGGCGFTNSGNNFNDAALMSRSPDQNWANSAYKECE